MNRLTSAAELEILRRVTTIVADVLGHDALALEPTTRAADVDGWDSVSHVQIVVAVEKAFGVRFRTGELGAVADVGGLVQRIATRLDGATAGRT
jgi:acyl carrier protein